MPTLGPAAKSFKATRPAVCWLSTLHKPHLDTLYHNPGVRVEMPPWGISGHRTITNKQVPCLQSSV